MWPRVVEVMLGIWLLLSPFIFCHDLDRVLQWSVDLTVGTAVVLLGLFSFWETTRHAHLLTILAGLALASFGYFAEPYPTPPVLQNDLLIGLFLVMFAVIPNESTQPPVTWREANVDSK